METGHRAFRPLAKLQHSITKLKIGDFMSWNNRMLKVLLKSKIVFVEDNGTFQVPYMKGQVIDPPKHQVLLSERAIDPRIFP